MQRGDWGGQEGVAESDSEKENATQLWHTISNSGIDGNMTRTSLRSLIVS